MFKSTLGILQKKHNFPSFIPSYVSAAFYVRHWLSYKMFLENESL